LNGLLNKHQVWHTIQSEVTWCQSRRFLELIHFMYIFL